MEIRRGDTLRLRLAIADDTFAYVGDELGALIKKIAPRTQTSVVESAQTPAKLTEMPEFIVSETHANDDHTYHATLRDHLTALFGSLCDTALSDALEIARQERDRRADGGN